MSAGSEQRDMSNRVRQRVKENEVKRSGGSGIGAGYKSRSGNEYRDMADQIMEEEAMMRSSSGVSGGPAAGGPASAMADPMAAQMQQAQAPQQMASNVPPVEALAEATPEILNALLMEMVGEEWMPEELEMLMGMPPEQRHQVFMNVAETDFMEDPFADVGATANNGNPTTGQLADDDTYYQNKMMQAPQR